MKCPTCGRDGQGKFCGKCGAKLDEPAAAPESGRTCPACGQSLPPQARFCGKCGARPEAAEPAAAGPASRMASGNIFWMVQPGQIACRLSETVLDQYENARGVVIHDGTRALVYCSGDLIGEFAAGAYVFPEDAVETRTFRRGGLAGLLKGSGRLIVNLVLGRKVTETKGRPAPQPVRGPKPMTVDSMIEAASAKTPFSVVLTRDEPFPLVFRFDAMATAEIRTPVALQVMARVDDLTGLARTLLVDQDMLTAQSLARALEPVVEAELAAALARYKLAEIPRNTQLNAALTESLNQAAQGVYAFLSITRVVKVECRSEELERLTQLGEELYLSEKELDQLTRRHEFSNRLRMEENQHRLAEARTAVDLKKQMQEINQDDLLSDAELDKFARLLKTDRRIAEARSEGDYQAALADIAKSDLLGKEELDSLKQAVSDRAEDQRLRRAHVLDLLQVSNRLEADRARLSWEQEIGEQQRALDLQRQRKDYERQLVELDVQIESSRRKDDYADQRRDSDEAFKRRQRTGEAEDKRRARALETEAERQEELSRLEVAEKAQALTEQRRQAEHEREVQKLTVEQQHERAKLALEKDRQIELAAQYKGMTAEQIMAANPSMPAESARAFAEKFKAEAARAAGDDRAALAEKHTAEMRGFMEKQMDLARDMVRANADIVSGMAKARDAEVDRARTQAVGVVGDTVRAVTGAKREPAGAFSARSERRCAACGKNLGPDDGFCNHCGARYAPGA